jgi:hypothetical protein
MRVVSSFEGRKLMKSVSRLHCFAACVGVGILAMASASHAAIIGPYTADANTLHLWHINETTLDVADDPSVGTPIGLTSLGTGGGNALGATSYPGFGNAYSGVAVANTGLFANAPTSSSADDTSTATFWNQTTGAFTYECMVRIDFDPSLADPLVSDFVGLITMDQDSGTRPFSYYLNPVLGGYTMTFGPGSAPTTVESAQLAITQGHWYHAAVAYDGNEGVAGNTSFYWTDMGTQATPDGSATIANLVFSGTLAADLTGASGDFAIGAEARGTQTTQWLGLIDEVRISDVARGADQFIFVPEPSTVLLFACGVAAMGLVKLRSRR